MERLMKTYVATSGTIFGVVVLLHIMRAFAEGPHVARDPVFILLTIAAGALCAWAFTLLRPTRS
jgi:hypothetical protein